MSFMNPVLRAKIPASKNIITTGSTLKVGASRIPASHFRRKAARRNHGNRFSNSIPPTSPTLLGPILAWGRLNQQESLRSFSQGRIEWKEKGKEKEKPAGLTLNVTQDHRDRGLTVGQILEERIPSTSKSYGNFLCARSSCGKLLSFHEKVLESTRDLTFLTFDSPDPAGREAFWLSSAYLLATALQIHFGSHLKLNGKPNLLSRGSGGDGYNYEFLIDNGNNIANERGDSSTKLDLVLDLLNSRNGASSPKLTQEDLSKVENIMKDLISQDLPLRTELIEKEKAFEIFSANPFKLERIESLISKDQEATHPGRIRILKIGESLIDLAPEVGEMALVPSTKLLQAQKLTDWSTTTWLPTAPTKASIPTNQSLLLIRGISFPKEALLSKYLKLQEEAAKSDHRIIGKQQDLFFINDSSPGTPFFLPNGTKIFRKIERVIRDLYQHFDYHEVISPQIFKQSLWRKSGHWENYRDDMFSVEGFNEKETRLQNEIEKQMSALGKEEIESRGCCPAHSESSQSEKIRDEDDESFGLKPMNCPGHCLIFKNQERSYRDLPIRFAEFSPLHRNESSGSLSGLTRVRRFHQDDAHVFCTPSQVSSEISSMLNMLTSAYSTFGFHSYEIVLSTRPPKFVGEIQEWDLAEDSLKKTLKDLHVDYKLNQGDGAFYGPKIDIRLFDSKGRKFQTATIQLDFQLPRRFDLKYSLPSSSGTTSENAGNPANVSHARPVMIHRAILGSVERFFAILLENNAGRFPFWLNPKQVIILPVGNSPIISDHVKRVKSILSTGNPDSEAFTQKKRTTHFFNVEIDNSGETLNKMVKKAQLSKFNFILFVGEKEARNGTVSVRARDGETQDAEAKAGEQGEGEGEAGSNRGENRGFQIVEGRPAFRKDMGQWDLESLRSMFVRLDDHNL